MKTTTVVGHAGLEEDLARRLRGAARVAIVGIGDELQRPDRLGMLAAKELQGLGLPGVLVFLAGTVPESVTGPVRRFRPDHILLLDAADLGLRPGTVAVVDSDRVVARTLSTHSLPLSVVMQYLEKTTGSPATLVGIQPDLRARGDDLTGFEEAGLARIVGCIHRCLGARDLRPARSRAL